MNRMLRRTWLSALTVALTAGHIEAQSAITHYSWQDDRTFEPYTWTARAITGAIALGGNTKAFSEGSQVTITFDNGPLRVLTSAAGFWRAWSHIEPDILITAEMFRLDQDPGALVSGNFLCEEDNPAKWLVFYESYFMSSSQLNMLVFSTEEQPFDINSPGLCGTFSYVID